MLLALDAVQRIAVEVATEQDPALEVAVSRAEGDSAYTELILTLRGCSDEPCQTLIGIGRDVPEVQLRSVLIHHMRQHLTDHGDGAV